MRKRRRRVGGGEEMGEHTAKQTAAFYIDRVADHVLSGTVLRKVGVRGNQRLARFRPRR